MIIFVRRTLTIALVASLVACGKKHDGATTTATATATALAPVPHLPECDAYFDKARACLDKLAGDERRQLQLGVEQLENQLRRAQSDIAKKSVSTGCTAQLDDLGDDCGQGDGEGED
jgi:hypothetical protein